MLTGKYKSVADFEENDARMTWSPRMSKENFSKNLKLVDEISAIAVKKGCTPGQLTLAWLMSQGNDIVPIFGTRRIKYFDENIGALKVEVTKEEDAEIRRIIGSCEVFGDRFPDFMMGELFGNTPPLKE